MRIRQANDNHPMVQQRRVERRESRLLTTMLTGGTAKDTADLSHQRPPSPQLAGLIQEVAHLCGHVSESRGSTENDGIVLIEFIGVRDRCRLLQLES